MPLDWERIYDRALRDGVALSGYYNRNYKTTTEMGDVIVRVPIVGCAEMDLKVWPTAEVMQIVRAAGVMVPQVLYRHHSPDFEIHQYVPGSCVDLAYPKGTPVPDRILRDLVVTITKLQRLSREDMPALPATWPAEADTVTWGRMMLDHTRSMYERLVMSYGSLFEALGIPPVPLEQIDARMGQLHSRPFRVLHGDLHRKNLIDDGVDTRILDWELALWGDPLYEVAVHLHKIAYPPTQHREFLSTLMAHTTVLKATNQASDLAIYMAHERCKSAIVDSVRYQQQLHDPCLPADKAARLCRHLAMKLAQAQQIWHYRTVPPIQDIRAMLVGLGPR